MIANTHTSMSDLTATAPRATAPRCPLDATRICKPRPELSPRQEEIAKLVADGLIHKQVAEALGLTEGTVKVYMVQIYDRLGFSSKLNGRAQLVRWWIEHRENKGAE